MQGAQRARAPSQQYAGAQRARPPSQHVGCARQEEDPSRPSLAEPQLLPASEFVELQGKLRGGAAFFTARVAGHAKPSTLLFTCLGMVEADQYDPTSGRTTESYQARMKNIARLIGPARALLIHISNADADKLVELFLLGATQQRQQDHPFLAAPPMTLKAASRKVFLLQ